MAQQVKFQVDLVRIGLNIIYSGTEYTEKQGVGAVCSATLPSPDFLFRINKTMK